MDLIQGGVGLAVLATAAAVAAAAWWLARPRRVRGSAVPASHLDRVRALPAFQALVRTEWRLRRLEAVFLTIALAGAALMGARLVGVGDDSEEMRTREVVLCLDVSGSMRHLDAEVIATYQTLVAQLEEERIGFVMFDGYAVTVFPLTGEREYIAEQLARAKAAIESGPALGVRANNLGSSLIGDGLATCVQHFDRPEDLRSRTIVLATDNQVAGDAIYTVPQARRIAQESNVMVFGIMPADNEPHATETMRAEVEKTNGEVLTIAPGEPTNVARISTAIKHRQKAALLAMAQDRSFDRVVPGAMLLLLGLAGALAASWRRS